MVITFVYFFKHQNEQKFIICDILIRIISGGNFLNSVQLVSKSGLICYLTLKNFLETFYVKKKKKFSFNYCFDHIKILNHLMNVN